MNKEQIFELFRKYIYRKPKQAIAGGLAILFIIILSAAGLRSDDISGGSAEPYYTVKSGPLTINISESGRLSNKDDIVVKNETDRSLKILFLAEEGTIVKKGDLIVELEREKLEAERDGYRLDVQRYEADLVAAEENTEILKNQMQSDIDKARLNVKFAKMDLERITEGVHPRALENADANIAIAEEDLERAEEDYAWSEQLHKKGFITLKELKADELSAKQKKLNLRIKKSDRELLVKYTHPQEIEKVQAEVKQSEMALERVERTAKAQLSGQEAKVLRVQAELQESRKDLSNAEERLEACRMYAPADGMVVYETSSGGWRRRRSDREQMDVGATVHPMHELIRMPTSNIMLAEISIQEATKPKLKEGMPAVITVDALPGQTFSGRINKIGILPDSTQSWLNPDLKVYKCEVELDSGNDKMRPGMNCQVDIVLEHYDSAIFVPIQCVLQVNGRPTVYVKSAIGHKKRVVQTGLDNNIMIHILSGLEDGDVVMLSPPLDEATKVNNGFHDSKKKSENRAQGEAPEKSRRRKKPVK